ncbi:hypothetical protein C8R47DRAFT_1227286 [Mycena vitilis]|nr:hypothetical protein C8R47DRAFT_1227286 [Mycena vitilis]
MAPRGWTTTAEAELLLSFFSDFVKHQAQKKLAKFWPVVEEAWFQAFSEAARTNFDKTTATPEQWTALKEATEARKRRIRNWFRHQKTKVSKAPARRKSDSSLAAALFSAKPTRRRAHHVTEVFQQRNAEKIKEELNKRGFNTLNEEVMAMDVEDWLNESREAQVARIKEAKRKRMLLRTEVVSELIGMAPESERQAIAETIQQEKEEMAKAAVGSSDLLGELSAEERQICIDESNDVIGKVLKGIYDKTGWLSFMIWGGPNPRLGGDLSLKCATYGETPAGNDFIAQHAKFDDGISNPFQHFLRRCFDGGVLREPLPTEDASGTQGGVSAMQEQVSTPPAPEPSVAKTTKTKKPKRMRKPKAAVVPPPPAPAPAVPGEPTTPTNDETMLRFSEERDNDFFMDSSSLQLDGGSPSQPDGYSGLFGARLRTPPPPPPQRQLWLSSDSLPSWPAGMPPPTSPASAERLAAFERGDRNAATTASPSYAGPTYAAPRYGSPADRSIDPSLLCTPQRPKPRPTFKGALGNLGVSRGDSGFPDVTPPLFFSQGAAERARVNPLFDTLNAHFASSPVRAGNATADTSTGSDTSPVRTGASGAAARAAADAAAIAGAGSAGSSGPPPPRRRFPGSRPMANLPKSAKKTVELALKKAVKKAAGKGKGRKKAAPLTDITNAFEAPAAAPDALPDAPPEPPTAPPAPPAAPARPAAPAAPVLVMSMGNETRDFNKRVDKEKAEREKAKKKERARLHNPAGGADLLILTRPVRERKAPPRADDGYVPIAPKLTRAQQQAAQRDPSANKLVARSIKEKAEKAAAGDVSGGASRGRKKKVT